MRVLLAFDKFKDALGARAAGEAAAGALRAKHPDWILDLCPLTDGGEGFCETLTAAAGGRLEPVEVAGPHGGRVRAPIGYLDWNRIPAAARARLAVENAATLAVVDLPSASGLALLAPSLRDPWHTATRGTGEMLRLAADARVDAILLGVGGSATNDLGLGALAALGYKFLDDAGAAIAVPVPATWERIRRIDRAGATPLPPVLIACDVTNHLLGPRGATATFGPQKGLRAGDVPLLEAQAARMAALLCAACDQPPALADVPGTGAAGGIAFGLMVACGARLVPGFDLVSDWLDLPARLAAADLVLTGEGRFDATSLAGKGPGSLVREARRLGKPAHVFAGSLGVPADATHHAITPAGLPLAAALPRTAELLAAAVGRAV
jgi:glycerate 2-kinase